MNKNANADVRRLTRATRKAGKSLPLTPCSPMAPGGTPQTVHKTSTTAHIAILTKYGYMGVATEVKGVYCSLWELLVGSCLQ